MNKEIKKEWVDNLKSGKYYQTKNYLKTDEGYCCLGVLTDMYIKATGKKWVKPKSCIDEPSIADNMIESIYKLEGNTSYQLLAEEVCMWAGLRTNDPTAYIRDEDHLLRNRDLITMNDNGHSFTEIAEVIERAENL